MPFGASFYNGFTQLIATKRRKKAQKAGVFIQDAAMVFIRRL
jgi:hypothetical protein